VTVIIDMLGYVIDTNTVYIPVLPLTSWLLSRKGGLRTAVVLNQIMMTLGMSLRILPNLIPSLFPYAIWFLHVAQFLNGAAGPVVMAAASLLSAQWYSYSLIIILLFLK
jgi:hypothetical protein